MVAHHGNLVCQFSIQQYLGALLLYHFVFSYYRYPTAWIQRSRLGFYFRAIRGKIQDAACSLDFSTWHFTRWWPWNLAVNGSLGTVPIPIPGCFIDPSSTFALTISILILYACGSGRNKFVVGAQIPSARLSSSPLRSTPAKFLGGSGQGDRLDGLFCVDHGDLCLSTQGFNWFAASAERKVGYGGNSQG